MNIKNLGLTQIRILNELCSGKVITVVYDYSIMKADISLTDGDQTNYYEKIHPAILQRLSSRNLLNETEFNPCLQIQINTFSIKPEAIELLKTHKHYHFTEPF